MNLLSVLWNAITTLYKQSKQEQKEKPIVIIPTSSLPSDALNYHIGDLTEKYETSNRGPGYISSGSSWGDPGGDSYGSYQLETKKGTMQDYLAHKDVFTDALRGLEVNSPAFRAKWKELAVKDPQGFRQSQFNFLARKRNGYLDAISYAKSLGWNTSSLAMQSAIFSTSNQSYGWKKIFVRAGITNTDLLPEQINKLYNARAEYFRILSLPIKVKKAIIQERTVHERKDCLTLVR